MTIRAFSNLFLSILCLAAVAAVPAFLAVQPAAAGDAAPAPSVPQQVLFFDQRNKVLIGGLAPGQVVSVYGVDGSDTPVFDAQGQPSGRHAGDYLGPNDGKLLEIYIPLSPVAEGPHARVSRLFLWTPEAGWRLLASLAPLESFPDTWVWVD